MGGRFAFVYVFHLAMQSVTSPCSLVPLLFKKERLQPCSICNFVHSPSSFSKVIADAIIPLQPERDLNGMHFVRKGDFKGQYLSLT